MSLTPKSQLLDNLYQLLQKIYVDNSMKAKFACDTNYGLVALANDAERLHVQADYTIKRRIDLIYARTAKAIIADGNLDLLGLSRHVKEQVGLPSWVPDWSCGLRRSFAWRSRADSQPFFRGLWRK